MKVFSDDVLMHQVVAEVEDTVVGEVVVVAAVVVDWIPSHENLKQDSCDHYQTQEDEYQKRKAEDFVWDGSDFHSLHMVEVDVLHGRLQSSAFAHQEEVVPVDHLKRYALVEVAEFLRYSVNSVAFEVVAPAAFVRTAHYAVQQRLATSRSSVPLLRKSTSTHP